MNLIKKKKLVQFDFTEKATPSYYLYFTINGSGTTNTNPEGYLVFYGVKGWDDSVPPEIYDHALETGMFEYDNGNMKMYNDIDMNNHKIKNSAPPTEPTDLLMKQSLDIFTTTHMGKINQNGFFIVEDDTFQLNNVYIKEIRIYNFIRLTGSDRIIIKSRSVHTNLTYPISYTNATLIDITTNLRLSRLLSIRLEKGRNILWRIELLPLRII